MRGGELTPDFSGVAPHATVAVGRAALVNFPFLYTDTASRLQNVGLIEESTMDIAAARLQIGLVDDALEPRRRLEEVVDRADALLKKTDAHFAELTTLGLRGARRIVSQYVRMRRGGKP